MQNNPIINHQLPITMSKAYPITNDSSLVIFKRLFLTIFLILFPAITSAQTLKIASYNVENLFDMQRSGLEYKEYLPNHHNWTEPILRKKLEHIAEVICDLDADIIGLQEVENDHILQRLQKVLKRVGCDYPYRAITDSKQTPIHNALLSKVAIQKRRDVVISRTGRHRSILEVVLREEPELRIFVNHWKSKAGPESQRLPYAKAMMRRIAALPQDSEYIILGDFNSDYHEFQVMDAKHNDTEGITGVNHILKTIRSGKMIRWHELASGYHYSLWMELPAYARWSHNFYGDKEGIDAIIIPASLHDAANWEYQQGSFGVFKPDYLFGKRGRVKRWEYTHSKHTGKGYSDHLPVYATFETGAKRTATQTSSKGLLDRVLSLFSSESSEPPPVPKEIPRITVSSVSTATIAQIIEMDNIRNPVKLDNVKVIFKHRDTVIIKQSPQGRAILLYRCAGEMEQGRAYDITAFLKKRYKGLDELVDITVREDLGMIDTTRYLQPFRAMMMQQKRYVNEVVGDLEGVYRKKMLVMGDVEMPLYFKKGVKRPKVGSRIRIKRAQIGYYKTYNELVVWETKDYQVLE